MSCAEPFLYRFRIVLASPVALIGLPTGRTLCGLQIVLTECAATVNIDFVAGDIRAPGDVGVPVGVDVAPVTVITAAPTVPAVSAAAYRVAIIMADVVVIVPIIIVGPFHDAPSQKPSYHSPGTEGEQGIGS